MKTTTTVVLGLMAALVCAAGAVAADPGEDPRATQDDNCPPVWIDAYGNPHVDTDCLPIRFPPDL